ncbi:MAG: zinc ribbon domain-containing protein [Anaerolineales bacterium]|nr:zinc ribbon domain-containing protein [Anaerolineales bacterium]
MDSFTSVVTDNLGKAIEEVDKLLKSPRTRVEILTLNRQMRTVTSELGKRTLELYKKGRVQDPELGELCARIVGIEARIAEREARLAQQSQTERPEEVKDIQCPRCNTAIAEDAVFCSKCGYKMETGVKEPPVKTANFCSHCGRELRPEAKFCPRCGNSA